MVRDELGSGKPAPPAVGTSTVRPRRSGRTAPVSTEPVVGVPAGNVFGMFDTGMILP